MNKLEDTSKSATYIELFFDLVFVYAITQISELLYTHPNDWFKILTIALMMWWGWSQYAWATNTISLNNKIEKLLMLLATGVTFFAAITAPYSFEEHFTWFGILYSISRIIAASIHFWGARGDQEHIASLFTYYPISAISILITITGSFMTPNLRIYFWVSSLLIDIIASISGGRGAWKVNPKHIAERHALIIIITLGEALLAIGLKSNEILGNRSSAYAAIISFLILACFWWIYFEILQQPLEYIITIVKDNKVRSTLVRDFYTYLHLPYVITILILALTFKNIIDHPLDELSSLNFYLVNVGMSFFAITTFIIFVRIYKKIPLYFSTTNIAAIIGFLFCREFSGNIILSYLLVVSFIYCFVLYKDFKLISTSQR